jgi:hypothetical protein
MFRDFVIKKSIKYKNFLFRKLGQALGIIGKPSIGSRFNGDDFVISRPKVWDRMIFCYCKFNKNKSIVK